MQNTTLPHVYEDLKIVVAILYLQYNSIESDIGFQREIVEKMLARENIETMWDSLDQKSARNKWLLSTM
jgi:hypothetical protein